MRKRVVFIDLVHLAAAHSGRRAQLFVVGDEPVRFLQWSTSPASWGLDRATTTRALFQERFRPLTTSIRDFTAGPGSHVELVDLLQLLPELARIPSGVLCLAALGTPSDNRR